MYVWIIVSAIAVIGFVFLLRAAYRRGRRRSMRACAAKGVFFVTLLRQGEKVWCRMTGGHVYEIEYLRTYLDRRFFRLTRLSFDLTGTEIVQRVHPESFFRHDELKVGDSCMCIPEPGRTSPITEISVTPLVPLRRAADGQFAHRTVYS